MKKLIQYLLRLKRRRDKRLRLLDIQKTMIKRLEYEYRPKSRLELLVGIREINNKLSKLK